MLAALTERFRNKKHVRKETALHHGKRSQNDGTPKCKTIPRRTLMERYTSLRRKDLMDITSIFEEDDSLASLLYSDNEEVEIDFQVHQKRQQLDSKLFPEQSSSSIQKSSGSERSSSSSMSMSKVLHTNERTEVAVPKTRETHTSMPSTGDGGLEKSISHGDATGLDDIIVAFARQRDPSRSKILVPSSKSMTTLEKNDCDTSTSSSIVSRASQKITKAWKATQKGACRIVGKRRSQSNPKKGGYTSCENDGENLDMLLERLTGTRDSSPKHSITSRTNTGFSEDSSHSKSHRASSAYNAGGTKDSAKSTTSSKSNIMNSKVLLSGAIPHSHSFTAKCTHVIHPVDIDHFLNNPDPEDGTFSDESKYCDSTISSLTFCSSLTLSSRSPTSVTDRKLLCTMDNKIGDPRENNLLYSESDKYGSFPTPRKLFDEKGESISKAFYREKDVTAYSMPSTMKVKYHHHISILMIESKRKVFEIVSVELTSRAMSIGNVLEKARLKAIDHDISSQTYVGLCNDSDFTSSFDIPILKFLPKDNTTRRDWFSSDDLVLQREMERRLLVAVPSYTSASECQKIRRLLWKNPKLQIWWHASAPLSRLGLA